MFSKSIQKGNKTLGCEYGLHYAKNEKTVTFAGGSMFIKVLITIALIIATIPGVRAFYGNVFGIRSEKYVYPSILITWGLIIYFMWFR